MLVARPALLGREYLTAHHRFGAIGACPVGATLVWARPFACKNSRACSKLAAMRQWYRSLVGSASCVGSAMMVLLAVGVGPAHAAARGRAVNSKDSQEKAARKACLTGDVSAGLSILADLFVEHQNPVYVFNQGRCLEQNSRYKEAIARFEEFLRIADNHNLPEDVKATGQKHLDGCKAKVAEESPVAAPPPVAQPLPQPPPQPAPPVQVVEKPNVQPEAPSDGKGLLIGGIVTGTVGVGAVVAGYFLGKKSNDLIAEMQTHPDSYTMGKHSDQQTYKTLAWVSYAVGGACVASGVVMIAIGASRSASPSQTDVALVPVLNHRS